MITLSGVARGEGASTDPHPGAKALEVHRHTLFRHLKYAFFSKNLSQNMRKCEYFRKKAEHSLRCPPAPPNSRVVTPTYWYRFIESASQELNLFYYFEK